MSNTGNMGILMNLRALFPLLTVTILAVLTAACAPLALPHGFASAPTSSVVLRAGAVALAASPDGTMIAFGRKGLQLRNNVSGPWRQLATETPLALAWRRDGQQLAAAFFTAEQNRGQLVIFTATGQRVDAWELPGRIVALAWSSRDDLLAAGYRLQTYSFGANLAQWLIHVKAAQMEKISLGDMTIKPATASQWASTLPELLSVAFSPDGDELVQLRLHDPPQFPPYLRLIHRNWQVPGERRLKDLPVQPILIDWTASAEAVVLQPSGQPAQRLELWPVAPVAGGGAPDPAAPPHDDLRWTLRKWRFAGLITPEEFQEELP
jgi:hypothetical protein